MSNTYTPPVEWAEELLFNKSSAENVVQFMNSERYSELSENARQDFFRTAVIILLDKILYEIRD